jgi:hypothetical protein
MNCCSDFGIKSDFMLGHSTGENVALMASRTIRKLSRAELMSKVRLFNGIYHKLSAADCIPKGALLSVGAIEPTFLRKGNRKLSRTPAFGDGQLSKSSCIIWQ